MAVFSLSCSRSKPEITFGFIQLVLYQVDGEPQEHFSFFILPHDEDGIENLDVLYLYHERDQLRWQIKSDEWVTFVEDGRTWIGSRGITIKDETLPRGVFRAVLINKGGESTERNFTFDGDVRFPFPEIEITSGNYSVNSQWPSNKLICYDGSGNYISTLRLEDPTGNVSDLRLPSNVRTVALWAEDESNSCSAYTNVVSVR